LASLGLHGGEYASANEMDAVVRKTEIQNKEQSETMPDDPIPEPFPQTQTSNGSAAEFHPSANWDAWIAIAKADIEKFSSSGDTMSWFEKNKEYLKDLEKESTTKHAKLAELWSDKHERMNP
jgi:hypothetical protein